MCFFSSECYFGNGFVEYFSVKCCSAECFSTVCYSVECSSAECYSTEWLLCVVSTKRHFYKFGVSSKIHSLQLVNKIHTFLFSLLKPFDLICNNVPF
jgi:hypothetical protein